MTATRQSHPDDIEFGSVLAAIRRALPRLLVITAVIVGLVFAGLALAQPRYSSVTRILIGKADTVFTKPKGTTETTETVTQKIDKEAVQSQVQVILSRNLMAKLAQELDLARRPEFNSALPSPGALNSILRLLGIGGPRPGQSEQDRVLEALTERLRIFQIKDSRVITVEMSSVDPKLAADVANKLADLYIAGQKTISLRQTKGASDWLGDQIQTLRREVLEAERAVEAFRSKSGLQTTGGEHKVTLNAQQLAELSTELSKAGALRAEAEARAKLIREMMQRGSADAAPDVLKSALIQRLLEQRVLLERQISELSATLLPAHPRMRQINADLTNLRRQLRQEVAKVVESLEKEARVAGLREAALKASLDQLKGRSATTADAEVKLRSLEREAKSKREILEAYMQRYSDARSRRNPQSVPVDAEIIERAVAASVPSWPKKPQILLLTTAATLLGGLGIVVTRALFAGARPQPPARSAPGRSGAASAPPSLSSGSSPAMPVPAAAAPAAGLVSQMTSTTAVAQRLLERAEGTAGFRSILTGAQPGIMPSTEAMEIASALAKAGRQVLLVDLGRPAGERQPGLADVIIGTTSLETAVTLIPGTEVHYLSHGSATGRAAAIGDADRLNLIFDTLDETFEHICIYGDNASTRSLFTTMQGRFDIGIVVNRGRPEAAPTGFLGYDVSDFEVIQLHRPQAARGAGASVQPASPAPPA
ncbi:MAG: GumC family protein [Hyphomicrobiaceae bacterium]